MKKVPETVIVELCQHLEIEHEFFVQCLEESVIEIH